MSDILKRIEEIESLAKSAARGVRCVDPLKTDKPAGVLDENGASIICADDNGYPFFVNPDDEHLFLAGRTLVLNLCAALRVAIAQRNSAVKSHVSAGMSGLVASTMLAHATQKLCVEGDEAIFLRLERNAS